MHLRLTHPSICSVHCHLCRETRSTLQLSGHVRVPALARSACRGASSLQPTDSKRLTTVSWVYVTLGWPSQECVAPVTAQLSRPCPGFEIIALVHVLAILLLSHRAQDVKHP